MHLCGFGSDIGLCWLLVVVSLCSVSVVRVCGFGSDIRLCRLLLAVNLCSVSVVCVRALVWIRYWALSSTYSCQYVFCFSCAWVWIRYRALSATCGCQPVFCFSRMCVHWFGSDIRLCRLCSVPVVCVCVHTLDVGLHRQLVAVSLFCFSCMCVGLDQISGFVGYLWLSVCVLFQLCVCVGLDQTLGFIGRL